MISPVKIWRRQKEIRNLLGRKGRIITWTIIYAPSLEFKRYAPYPVAMIELENGDKITAPLVDYDQSDLKFGVRVEVVLRKVRESGAEDVLVYGIKARPIE